MSIFFNVYSSNTDIVQKMPLYNGQAAFGHTLSAAFGSKEGQSAIGNMHSPLLIIVIVSFISATSVIIVVIPLLPFKHLDESGQAERTYM